MSLLKETAYKIADVATLGRGISREIGGTKIKFPARWSRWYVKDYEPETFEFLRENVKPGATVLDLGAHMGLFSVVMSQLVGKQGRVYSFEPTPSTRSVLKEVVKINGCSHNVQVRSEAVSREKGTFFFYDTGDLVSNANSLVQTARSAGKIEVNAISLDEFAAEQKEKINCLKIDVEGAELDLLEGAKKVFTEMRPVALLSLHPASIKANNQSLESIWDILESYKMRMIYEGKPATKESFCGHDELFDVNLFPA